MKKIPVGLFIFHRDFRLFDNSGLIKASRQCDKLYTCFIFTPEQVGKSNDYRSQNSIQFMIESLNELSNDISNQGGELMTFYGKQQIILRSLIQSLNINFAVSTFSGLQTCCGFSIFSSLFVSFIS